LIVPHLLLAFGDLVFDVVELIFVGTGAASAATRPWTSSAVRSRANAAELSSAASGAATTRLRVGRAWASANDRREQDSRDELDSRTSELHLSFSWNQS
jgi:hypothetical protein